MKLAIVHDWINGFAGGEQVVLALHHLYPEAPIYTSVYNRARTPQFDDARVIPTYLQKLPPLRARHQLAVPLMPRAFAALDVSAFDVIISVGGGLAKGVRTGPNQFHIFICCTPMRYLWKLGGDRRGEGIVRSRIAHRMRQWDVATAQRVDQFVAISRTVQDRIKRIYGRESIVIYPPVDTAKFPSVTTPQGDYFLTVGRLIGYKRVDLIIEACRRNHAPLKIVGVGPEEKRLRALAQGAPWIEFLGRVPDAELRGLYQNARAFLFAAEEDFGIVPVEAMSAGRPIIAYGVGGATETVRGGVTGLFFDEQTPDSLVAAMAEFRDEAFNPGIIHQHARQFDTAIFQAAIADLVAARPATRP